MNFPPIAIIGHGCIFPKVFSSEDLWVLLKNKRVPLGKIPQSHWPVQLQNILKDKEKWEPNFIYSDVGGYIDDMDGYDLPFKKMISRFLSKLNPVFRWTLSAACQALEMNGYLNNKKKLERSSFILGSVCTYNFLSQLFEKTYINSENIEKTDYFNRFVPGSISSFVSKELGLGAESFSLDAACSSSLYAIKFACDRLHDHSSDIMLAGGVQYGRLWSYMTLSALQALSPTGRSRPFAKGADGLVVSEGAAVLVLKRLDDAISDQDNILGVIRGVGLSNDGRAGGFLIPDQQGQSVSIQKTLEMSGIDATDISHIECHATGTQSGDGVELTTLKQFFSNAYLGALKGNIGHLLGAAGVAGMIKVLQSMRYNMLPGLPGSYEFRDEVLDSPLTVHRDHKIWENKYQIAAVNSFGFGGINSQVLVEKYRKELKLKGLKKIKKVSKKVALCALVIRTNKTKSLSDFIHSPLNQALKNNFLEKVSLNIAQTKFPPSDLNRISGEQLLMMEMLQDILTHAQIDSESTGVYIGAGANPANCRYTLRARIQEIYPYLEKSEREEVKNQVSDPQGAPEALGTLSNIIANCLSRQQDFKGPSLAIFSEEISGDMALDLAVRAIQKGEINSALVGAVELSKDKVHKQAIFNIKRDINIGQSAVLFLLQEKDLAEKSKNEILALISNKPCEFKDKDFVIIDNRKILIEKFGYSHVSSGLLNIAAGILSGLKKNKKIAVENDSFMGNKKKTYIFSPETNSSKKSTSLSGEKQGKNEPEEIYKDFYLNWSKLNLSILKVLPSKKNKTTEPLEYFSQKKYAIQDWHTKTTLCQLDYIKSSQKLYDQYFQTLSYLQKSLLKKTIQDLEFRLLQIWSN